MSHRTSTARTPLLVGLQALGLFLFGFLFQAAILLTGLPGGHVLVVAAGLAGAIVDVEFSRGASVFGSCFVSGLLFAVLQPVPRLIRAVCR